MNPERAKELLPIFTAFAEGKSIQIKYGASTDWEWRDLRNPQFGSEKAEYRIKPEPKEVWVNEYIGGGCCAYLTKEAAEIHVRGCSRIAVLYREVI